MPATRWIALAAMALLLALLGACGGGAPTATTTPGATTMPEATAAPGATTAAEATSAPVLTPAPRPEPVGDDEPLVIYSGRSEKLVGPLIEQFSAATGIKASVRYGDTAEMAALILEEGDNSPADVFYGQDAGALGALAAEGRLAPLPAALIEPVDSRFRSADNLWVGTSGRARVVVYNSTAVQEADLPTSIDGFTDPAWRGRVGWAPTNGSFQAFVTAYRVAEGEDAARSWLEGMLANEPKVYEGNSAIVQAVAAGEVDVGFVNHYYVWSFIAEQGEAFPARNHYLSGGDVGALINVAGVGVLNTSRRTQAAEAFVAYLLSAEAQQYFSDSTYEYPVVAGISANPALVPLADIEAPEIDLNDLSDLAGTLELLQDTGVLP
jgi:iron(III) transport system substrate-binding protein